MSTGAKSSTTRRLLRPFVQYSVDTGVLSREALADLVKVRSELDRRLGQLAALKGYMAPRDVLAVLAEQADSDFPFGEIAVGLGHLTRTQLRELLDLQQDPFRFFVELLRLSGIVAEPAIQRLVHDFTASGRADAPAAAEEPPAAPARKADELRGVLRRLKAAATVPEGVQRLLALLDEPESTLDQVLPLLQAEPAIAAQVLGLVNSAFFGLRHRVSSLRQAVVTVGFRGLRQVILFVRVLDVFVKAGREKTREVWRHSILASQWAQAIARARGWTDLETPLVAGLVHDLGRPAVLQHFPEASAEIGRRIREGGSAAEAELATLGLTHADAGAYLCHLWRFPVELHEAVLYHHCSVPFLRNVQGLPPLVNLVHLACGLASLPDDLPASRMAGALERGFAEYHRVDASTLAELAPQVREGASELTRLIT